MVAAQKESTSSSVQVGGRRVWAASLLVTHSLWFALGGLLLILAILSPEFRNLANLQNILMQNAMIGIVALGMLVMMICGGFDLSVGASGGAVAVLTAFTTLHLGVVPAILAGALLGVGIGFINGVLVARFKVNAFIATFAMASIITGVVFVITSGKPIVAKSPELQAVAYGAIAGVPTVFIIFAVFAIVTYLALRFTKPGHWIYSVGANKDASFLSGVPVGLVTIGAFAFGGLAVGLAGILLFAQSSIGQPSGATSWPLDAIAICVIGGVSLYGGVGRVSNVVAATLLMGVIRNGLNQLGISPYWQPAITGAIILVAVLADQFSRRRS